MIPISLVWLVLPLGANVEATSPKPAPVAAPLVTAPLVTESAEVEQGWSGSFNLGATYSSGNTERQSLAAGLDAKRRGEKDRTSFKAWWNTAKESSSTGSRRTEDNFGASLKYDYFATEKLFYNGFTGAEVDRRANLDLRFYAGAGVGYQFREEEDLKFSGELGLAYFKEEFSTSGNMDSVALRAAYGYMNRLTKTTVFQQDFEVFPAIDDFEDYFLKLDSRVRVDVTGNMFAQVQHLLNYDNTPAAGSDNSDNLVIAGVGWSF